MPKALAFAFSLRLRSKRSILSQIRKEEAMVEDLKAHCACLLQGRGFPRPQFCVCAIQPTNSKVCRDPADSGYMEFWVRQYLYFLKDLKQKDEEKFRLEVP